MSRARTALPLVLTYWVVLLLGLVLYTAARRDATDIVSILWAGSVFGTLVGHLLGLTNVRLWFTAIVVGGLVLLGLAGPASPDRNVFWMSFAPATIFAAISVGDRWSLAAFWFPAMVWMLTILDGTNGKSTPDGTAAVTLGALALAFVVFLRVRETRRVALWKTVAARPLATPALSTVFKEPPGKEVARAFWMLGTSALVFAFTAWLAPQLWEVETFGADPKVTASSAGPEGGGGPPCCEDLAEAERSRVKEYFDFGRGRDALTGNTETQCRQCYPDDDGGSGGGSARLDYCTDADFELGYCIKCTSEDIESGLCVLCTDEQIARGVCVYGRWVGSGYRGGGGGGGGGAGAGGAGGGGAGGTGGTGTSGAGAGGGIASNWDAPRPTPHYEPPTTYTPPTPTYQPRIEPTPIPQVHKPEPIQPEPRQPESQVAPTPIPQPETPPVPTPSTNEPTAPEPQPHSAPPKTDRPAPSATRAQKPASANQTSELMRWLSAFIAAIIALQLLRFLFRPLRRMIHLRHLRRPFWEETVDQRVSNWWQLVLVGLRDAGYRTTSDEQPREFARRTGVDGVEKAAAILDRTRHGIRVDQDDLEEMSTASEAAYRSAREGTSTLARAAAQIRWPLA